jgi:signal transduction histidine kinase
VARPTVLIVDDDAPTRRLFQIILEGEGFSCVDAGDAADALAAVRAGGVEVALCDVRLGEEDGLGLATTLLEDPSSIAVVMITGVDDPDMAEAAVTLGAYGYLVKPVRRSELILNVTNAVRRRELEMRQRDLVTDLEARVSERTAELQAALERAEQAEAVRSQFVQNVSHELRTPLTVILAGAGLITRTDPDRLASVAASIESQGKRLLLLIERLLEVASLDENRPSVPLVPIEVRGLLALAADPARAMGRDVTIDVRDDVPLVGSQQRLVSALSHLVDNAVKFTPPSSRLRMRAEVDQPEHEWVIEIADDGPGIPEAIRDRMWEPFVQADGSAVRERGGLGVGLYLCRRLVEWHGGRVLAEETPGGGLTVVIRLPTIPPG